MRTSRFKNWRFHALMVIGFCGSSYAVSDSSKVQHPPVIGITAPVAIKTVEAEYSIEARRLHVEGVCLVSLVVDVKGMPQNVHVTRCVDPSLEQPSRDAVQQYRFEPAKTPDGKSIAVQLMVEVTYHLVFKPHEDFCQLAEHHGLVVQLGFKPLATNGPPVSGNGTSLPALDKFTDRGFCRSGYTSPRPVTCEATATINEKGKVADLENLHCDLENAQGVAEESLRNSHFKPAESHGKRVAMSATLLLNFGRQP